MSSSYRRIYNAILYCINIPSLFAESTTSFSPLLASLLLMFPCEGTLSPLLLTDASVEANALIQLDASLYAIALIKLVVTGTLQWQETHIGKICCKHIEVSFDALFEASWHYFCFTWVLV